MTCQCLDGEDAKAGVTSWGVGALTLITGPETTETGLLVF